MKKHFFFFFFEEKQQKKKKLVVDYDYLYQKLLEGPLRSKDIEEITGVSHSGVFQIITTLSINYPIWSPSRGVYKLIEDSDYD